MNKKNIASLLTITIFYILLVGTYLTPQSVNSQEESEFEPISYSNYASFQKNQAPKELYVDQTHVWASTDKGIVRWNINTQHLDLLNGAYALPNKTVNDMLTGPDKKHYVATDAGLYIYENNSFQLFNGTAGANVKSLVFDQSNNPVILASSNVFKYENGKWSSLPNELPYCIDSILNGNFLEIDKSGTLYLSSYTHPTCEYTKKGWDSLTLNGGSINASAMDVQENGDLWMAGRFFNSMGSIDSGIVIKTESGTIETYSASQYPSLGSFIKLVVRPDGTAWFYNGNGYGSFSRTRSHHSQLTNRIFMNDQVDIFFDDANNLWTTDGYVQVDWSNGGSTRYMDGAPFLFTTIGFDANGNQWVNGIGNGVAMYDGVRWKYMNNGALSEADSSDARVEKIQTTDDGSVWIKLVKQNYDHDEPDLKTIRYLDGEITEHSNSISLDVDDEGVVWSSRYDGVYAETTSGNETIYTYEQLGLQSVEPGAFQPLRLDKVLAKQNSIWVNYKDDGCYGTGCETGVLQFNSGGWTDHQPFPQQYLTYEDPAFPDSPPSVTKTNDHQVRDIDYSVEGVIWALSDNRLAYFQDDNTWKIIDLPMLPYEGKSIQAVSHGKFVVDRAGLVWVPVVLEDIYMGAGMVERLLIYNPENESWTVDSRDTWQNFHNNIIHSPNKGQIALSVNEINPSETEGHGLLLVNSFLPSNQQFIPLVSR